MTETRVKLYEFDSRKGFERGAGKLKEACWYLLKVFFFLSPLPYPSSLKRAILKMFGAKIGRGVVIKPRVNIHFPWKLEIGDYAWIGEEVFILNFEQVAIGKNACISQRAFLCGGNHDFRDPQFSYRNGEIILEDGVWVGASCFIGPSVRIGLDSVIGAGSVLTSSVEKNGIYRGNPAVFLKNRWADLA